MDIGSWISCINPFHNPVKHYFFRHIPSSKYFTQGDVAKLCPICWFEAHSINSPIAPQRVYRTNKNSDSKPEKDSL